MSHILPTSMFHVEHADSPIPEIEVLSGQLIPHPGI